MTDDTVQAVKSVAIVGSFRQHYDDVLNAWLSFSNIGLNVTSPKGTPIIEHGVLFVRFLSDPSYWSDSLIQTVALHRILQAHFVYVVVPNGYVGRTTCYEIGRVIQAKRPIYFSEYPRDLPIWVPDEHICSTSTILSLIERNAFLPKPLYLNDSAGNASYERDLLLGKYRGDDEFQD